MKKIIAIIFCALLIGIFAKAPTTNHASDVNVGGTHSTHNSEVY